LLKKTHRYVWRFLIFETTSAFQQKSTFLWKQIICSTLVNLFEILFFSQRQNLANISKQTQN
jgi:hypothetical protein